MPDRHDEIPSGNQLSADPGIGFVTVKASNSVLFGVQTTRFPTAINAIGGHHNGNLKCFSINSPFGIWASLLSPKCVVKNHNTQGIPSFPYLFLSLTEQSGIKTARNGYCIKMDGFFCTILFFFRRHSILK